MREVACRWFCVWLFLLSISPTVGHAHAGGGVAHTHFAICEDSSDLPSGDDAWHWHMLLLGLEIHVPPGSSPLEAPPCTSDAPVLDLGADLDEVRMPPPPAEQISLFDTSFVLQRTPFDLHPAAFDTPFPLCLSASEMLRTSNLIV